MLKDVPKIERSGGISPKPIREAWKEYKSVSHFWAARMLAGEVPPHLDLLRWSEQLLKESISVNVTGITLADAWRPPKDLSLPGKSLEIPPLDEDVLRVLHDYDSTIIKTGHRT